MSRTPAQPIPVASSRVLVELETQVAHALNAVMLMAHTGGRPLRHHDLEPLHHSVAAITDKLSPVLGDDMDIAGVSSLTEFQYAHPAGAAALSIALGVCLGLPKPRLNDIGMAAALMNLGYAVLRSGAGESEHHESHGEVEIRAHPPQGAEILGSSGLPDEVLRAITEHHERWDGSGFPAALSGDAIGLPARIIGLADAYVLLRSHRPHRRALGPRAATDFIMSGCGVLFDPEVVRVFARGLPHVALGARVALSSGEAGIVVDSNVGHVCRPVVRVASFNGVALSESYEVDLSRRDQLGTVILED